MLIKERTKSTTHLILESLNARMNLSFSDRQKYNNQAKGFEGECLFDQYISHPQQTGLIINDLLIDTGNTFYQMDSLLILNHQIYLYEIKNYSGLFCFKEDGLYTPSGHSIQSPWEQLNRKKAYLHNLLLNLGYDYSITGLVVFVHPNFYIFSLPPTTSTIFYGGLDEHFKEIYKNNQAEAVADKDLELAHTLVDKHVFNYRPLHLPDYNFKGLKKGIFCPKCFSFQHKDTRMTRTCVTCGFKEKITDAIYRSVYEFQLLFPILPITVQHLFLWCNRVYSKRRIRYLLNKKFTQHSKGPKTFYN